MIGIEFYARGWLRAVEFPVQVLAIGLLFLAYVMRYREVRAAADQPVTEDIADAKSAGIRQATPKLPKVCSEPSRTQALGSMRAKCPAP